MEERIPVEAKTFSCLYSGGVFIVKEAHKRWQRELSLSLDQARWVAEGLQVRSRNFGDYRRSESMNSDGVVLSLVEGGNKHGCFLSINLKNHRGSSIYLIVPAGRKGKHWNSVAVLLFNSIEEVRQKAELNSGMFPPETGIKNSGNSRELPRPGMSYLGALRVGDGNEFQALSRRINSLEMEVQALRFAAAASKEAIEKPSDGEHENRSTKGRLQNQTAAACPNCHMEKTKLQPLDIEDHHLTVKINQQLESDSIVLLCQRFIHELFTIISNQRGCHQIRVSDSSLNQQLDLSSGFEEQNIHNVGQKGKNLEDSQLSFDTKIVNELEVESKCSELEGFAKEISSKGDTDVFQDTNESDDSDDDCSSLNENDVYWDTINENYVHLSGMRFDPQRNKYFANFSENLDDLRCLYFVPKEGKFKLAHKGELGAINKKIVSDEDWEWSKVANSFQFPPNLLDLFRNKLVEKELSSM